MTFFTKNLRLLVIAFFLFSFAVFTYAHAPEQSYIFVRFQESSISGHFEITTDDLNRVLDLELPRGLSKDRLAPHIEAIQKYVIENASFSTDEGFQLRIRFTETNIMSAGPLGDYVQLGFNLDGIEEIPEKIHVKYSAIFDEIPKHQGLLVISYDWKAGIHENEAIPTLVFSKGDTEQVLPTSRSASILLGFAAMIKLGVWHIWIGIDHILFLFALLLPSVLRSRKDGELLGEIEKAGFWKPVEKFKPALINVVKVVTFFTIAHTITLSLASLELITLPSRLVESIIAISITLAAIHNIRPVLFGKEWVIAFVFGLFHGFGFASVLAEKGFGGDFLVWTLLGFNIGVELGQLVIIILIFPVLYFLRTTFLYQKIVFFGSVLLIFISIYWFIERAFDLDLPAGAYILRALGLL